jgi:hypothetical protein
LSYSKVKAALGGAFRRFARTVHWLVACSAMALAACEGAQTHQIAEQKPQVEPGWWGDMLMSGEDHLREAIFRACPIQGFLSNKKCVRAKIVESFGKQNDAGKHCLDENDLGWLFMCVAGFTATQQIYQTMGVDAQGAMDWGDSFESMNGLHRFMAARLIAKCPDMAEADCVAHELAVMLAVTPDEARYCVRTTDVTDAVRCGSALIRLETYKTAQKDVG